MLEQGWGHVYNLEGLGSDGRIVPGTTLYGSSKSAVAYLTRGMAQELPQGDVRISGLSPGMVITDLLLKGLDHNEIKAKKSRKIFNILADRVETVSPWLVSQIRANQKNGGTIRWLTTSKIIWRFLKAPFINRRIV